jgi:hypothetical protein
MKRQSETKTTEVKKKVPVKLAVQEVTRDGIIGFGFNQELELPGFLKDKKRRLSTLNETASN